MALTSPPYFNLELYADGEATQSHMKFPTPAWWREQFLGPPPRLDPAPPRPCTE